MAWGETNRAQPNVLNVCAVPGGVVEGTENAEAESRDRRVTIKRDLDVKDVCVDERGATI
jgi:hypothetical protein